MFQTIGFIGTGNMGSALARAAVKNVSPEKIFLSNRTAAKADTLAAELGCASMSKSNRRRSIMPVTGWECWCYRTW